MILLTDDFWEINAASERGRGVFAKKDIDAGTVIGDYIGKVIKTAEEDTVETDEGLYLMYYHDYASIYPIDVKAPGIHLINHSCTPNCWMYTYQGHTLFFALRHIFAGEELTVAYLLSPEDSCSPCTHACRCGSSLCYGTMHLSQDRFDKWSEFNEMQAKETKRLRIRYGKELPMLSFYPERIPDHPIYDLIGSSHTSSLSFDSHKLPTSQELRRLIRETGRTIEFPLLTTRVLGIQNDVLVSEGMERVNID